ncbi:MAG: CheR family methyltransferase [Coriobacteriia bacterium]
MIQPEGSIKKDLTAEQFEELRDWVHRHSGIFLDASRLDPLRISVVARATRLGHTDLSDYFLFLKRDEQEFKELMSLITINETSFFRFPGQFDALNQTVVPEILEGKSTMSRSFRAWSAGCSTGEEPYTIAMSLLDSQVPETELAIEVLGTDVSSQALDRAREAVYRAKSLANLSHRDVQRWFEPVSGGQRPVASVRDVVDFSYHNLIKEPYPLALMGNWDVIFCRNVTIYFKFESTRRVVNNLFDSLNPGGYLFIGHSESLTSISDRFEVVEVGDVFLYRKPRPRRHVSFGEAAAARDRGGSASSGKPTLRPGMDTSWWEMGSDSSAHANAKPRATPKPESESIAELVADAYRLLEEGRPIDAREAADRALVWDAECVEALIVRAYTHADDGDLDSAIQEARRVLKIDPLKPAAHYILGLIYQRQGDQDAAIEAFRRTIFVDPDFVLAHFNLANIYKSRSALADACREYRTTLSVLETCPEGSWTAFLGGFRTDLLAQTCERSLIECR